MAVINSSHFAYKLWPGVRAWYGETYNEFKPEYPALFVRVPSTRAYEEEVGSTGFGLANIIAEGSGVSYDTAEQGYMKRYTNVEYGLGFILTKNMVDDDQYQTPMRQRSQGLAFSMRQTKEINAANIFNRAFNSSYTGADGKEMCATDHPNKSGGTWSNELATSADLSEASLEQAVLNLFDITTDRGLTMSVKPKKLAIPGELIFEATRILESQLQSDSAENNINALKTMGIIPEVVVNHYFTDADAWFILTDVKDGLKYQERQADVFTVDNDFDTDNAKYKAKSRYVFGHTDPRCVFGSPGA